MVPASGQGRSGSGLGAELGKGKLRDARIKDGLPVLDCGLPILGFPSRCSDQDLTDTRRGYGSDLRAGDDRCRSRSGRAIEATAC